MKDYLNSIIRRVLKLEETDQKVKTIQQPVEETASKTVQKIEKLNNMLIIKSKTYYIGKAMGVIK